MKRLKQLSVLLLLLLSIAFDIKAQNIGEENCNTDISVTKASNVPTEFWGAVSYNINDPAVIVDMNISLSPYEHLQINNGILSSCMINGGHLRLTISRDDFMRHIYEQYKEQGYWDLLVDVAGMASDPWGSKVPVIIKYGIIRIIFS